VKGALLDTNVLSEVIKKVPSARVLERLRATPRDASFTSAICVMELRFGAARHPAGRSIWARIVRDVLPRVTVLPLGLAEAECAGEILADLERRGERIGVEDVLLGATARVAGLAVATRNVRHLCRVAGLVVENWWD
jgi:tRNA(fMet)-specific endonuclease VapC